MINCLKHGIDPFNDKNLHRMASKNSSQRKVVEPPQDHTLSTSQAQRQYRRNKKLAINTILGNESPRCEIDPKTITDYFKEIYRPSNCKPFNVFEKVMEKPTRLDDSFVRPFSRQEIRSIFQRIKNTAQAKIESIIMNFRILIQVSIYCP
uniref:Uncharacterized protein n=1 Tax=Acrobeloides nanus TaxID=290746 RepID=A0A914DGU8_9BILA